MTRATKTFMGLGAYEANFEARPHLVDLFIPGTHLMFFRGAEWWTTGVITEPTEIDRNRITVKGPGPEWWLGEDDKNGPVKPPQTHTALGTHQIIDALLYRQDGTRALNPGVINNGNVIPTFSHTWETIRRSIRRLAANTRTEYRVNPDFTFDWAGNSDLFQDRDVVFAESANTAESVEHTSSAFRVAGRVIVLAAGEGDHLIVRQATAVLPAAWKDWNNVAFQRDFIVDAPNANDEDEADFVAVAQAGLRGHISRAATIILKRPTQIADVEPGDTVYVYKEHVLEDTANDVAYRGRTYPAVQMRVGEVSVDIGQDWRVVHRSATGVETDVTKFITDRLTSSRVELKCTSDPEAFFAEINSEAGGLDARREDQGDKTIPAAPAGLNVTAAVYKDYGGEQFAKLSFDWTAVTLNTDGSAITDLARYVVRYRRVTGSPTDPWETVEALAPDVEASAESLPVGATWEAQVRAEDTANNTSVWAPGVPVNTDSDIDTTPPPQPKAPVATGGIDSVFVEWDYLDAALNPMPPDIRWYEVHASQTSGFTPTPATFIGAVTGTAFSFNVSVAGDWYVKLIAVDLAGNMSVSSAQSGAANVDLALVIPDYSVSGQQIAAAAISSDKTVFGDFGNLIDDPSFENSAAGGLTAPHAPGQFWEESAAGEAAPWTIVDADPGNARTGTSYASRLGNADSTAFLNAVNRVPSKQGDEFFAECFFKTAGAPNGTIALGIRWINGAGEQISTTTIQSSTADPTSYTLLQGKAVAPALTAYAQVFVSVTGHTTGTYFVDDVYARRTTIAVFISDAAIQTAHIAALQVGTAQIANLAVNSGKIADLAVTNAKIDTMVANKITTGSLVASVSISTGTIYALDAGGSMALMNSDGFSLWADELATDPESALQWFRSGVGVEPAFAAIYGRWDGDGEEALYALVDNQNGVRSSVRIQAGAGEISVTTPLDSLGFTVRADGGIFMCENIAVLNNIAVDFLSATALAWSSTTVPYVYDYPGGASVPNASLTPNEGVRSVMLLSATGLSRTGCTVNAYNMSGSADDLGINGFPFGDS